MQLHGIAKPRQQEESVAVGRPAGEGTGARILILSKAGGELRRNGRDVFSLNRGGPGYVGFCPGGNGGGDEQQQTGKTSHFLSSKMLGRSWKPRIRSQRPAIAKTCGTVMAMNCRPIGSPSVDRPQGIVNDGQPM